VTSIHTVRRRILSNSDVSEHQPRIAYAGTPQDFNSYTRRFHFRDRLLLDAEPPTAIILSSISFVVFTARRRNHYGTASFAKPYW
jgi:hypothetical protein